MFCKGESFTSSPAESRTEIKYIQESDSKYQARSREYVKDLPVNIEMLK